MNCPKCGGSEWKLAEVIHREGITHTTTQSSGSGVYISTDGLGVGGGGAQTDSLSQTAASLHAAPPRPPPIDRIPLRFLGYCGILIFGLSSLSMLYSLIFESDGSVKGFLVCVGITLIIFAWMVAGLQDHATFDINYAAWKKTKICTRCGQKYCDEPKINNSTSFEAIETKINEVAQITSETTQERPDRNFELDEQRLRDEYEQAKIRILNQYEEEMKKIDSDEENELKKIEADHKREIAKILDNADLDEGRKRRLKKAFGIPDTNAKRPRKKSSQKASENPQID